MEYHYPKFTPEMKKTHTILIPNMAVTQFRLMEYALRCEGYKCELLGNCGSAVAQLGLKYVHNDTCYPALLVIGQFLDALNSGKYDLEHTALLITQTGGGCRASNYIHLLRKALVKAGYPQIPVASLNFSGLEKDSGFQMTLPLARRALACIFYGDMLCALRNQVAPYENEKGAADRMVDRWIARLGRALLAGKGFTSREMKHTFPLIAKEFATIPVTRVPKVKVGVVGEIYVKYSPLGNNDLQKFLESQDCEVNFPGLMGFVQYCAFNMGEDHVLYGGKLAVKVGTDQFLNWLDSVERVMLKAETDAGFYAPGPFKELVKKPKGVISLGAKMGEGWLLTAEMIELVQGGYGNIVCAQPFGCLPNHIVGKGMVNKIRAALKKLPQHADRHGKAESDDGEKKRRQVKAHLFVAVEDVHEREPDSGAEKTVQGVQHGVPKCVFDIKAAHFAEDLRRKNEQQDDDLHRGRQTDAEITLYKRGC